MERFRQTPSDEGTHSQNVTEDRGCARTAAGLRDNRTQESLGPGVAGLPSEAHNTPDYQRSAASHGIVRTRCDDDPDSLPEGSRLVTRAIRDPSHDGGFDLGRRPCSRVLRNLHCSGHISSQYMATGGARGEPDAPRAGTLRLAYH